MIEDILNVLFVIVIYRGVHAVAGDGQAMG